MASTSNSALNDHATSEINNLVTSQIPWNGDWRYVTAGANQTIFADFNPTQTLSGDVNGKEIYYYSAQLANLYAGYSADGGSTGTFTTVAGDLPADGVALQGSAGGGLTDVLEDAYGNISYYLSGEAQKTHKAMKAKVDAEFQEVAQTVRDAYTANTIYVKAVPGIFGTATNVADPSAALAKSLGAVANLITAEGLIRRNTGYWDAYYAADNSTGYGENSKAEMMANLTDQITSALVNGTLIGKFSDNFQTGFGGIDPIYGTEKYTLPWTSELYSSYQGVVASGDNSSYISQNALMASNNQQLDYAQSYIATLNQYNQNADNIGTIQKDQYMTIAPGAQGAQGGFAPTYNTTPNQAKSSNSIHFSLSTAKGDSTTASASNGSSISWDTEASAGGWWWSASASNSGSDVTRTSWNKFDSHAEDMKGDFKWDNLKETEITPNATWFRTREIDAACSAKYTADNPNFEQGFGFANPTVAKQFITGELYRVASIAHGDAKSTITGTSTDAHNYDSDYFHSFEQTTTASAGVGWGPFSVGGSTTYETSNEQADKMTSFSNSGNSWTIVNDPMKGMSNPTTGAGTPSQMLGVTLERIGSDAATQINAGSSSSSKHHDDNEEHDGTAGDLTYSDPDSNSSAHKWYDLGHGEDVHFGDEKGEFIDGGEHHDVLYGFGGNDYLKGGDGDDVIYGMDGNNKIWGGNGNDCYVFQKHHIANGVNGFARIMDFNSDDDFISFSGYASDEVSNNGNRLYLDGVYAGKFEGMNGDQLGQMIAGAHYSDSV